MDGLFFICKKRKHNTILIVYGIMCVSNEPCQQWKRKMYLYDIMDIKKGRTPMICKTYPINKLKQYKYVVVLSEYEGKILLSRHKERTTWETQGGHIEPGETPMEAARRELWEESGAEEFDIEPLCDYWAGSEDEQSGANGMVFRAMIHQLGKIPESEMAEVRTFDKLPENITYPVITPVLFAYLRQHNQVSE